MKTEKYPNIVRRVGLLLTAAAVLATSNAPAYAAAFAVDYVNGVWGVAFSAETRPLERAVERATRFGANANRLTITTTLATKGFHVVYATGFCPDTKRWVGTFGYDKDPGRAKTKAVESTRASGAASVYVVKSWFDQ